LRAALLGAAGKVEPVIKPRLNPLEPFGAKEAGKAQILGNLQKFRVGAEHIRVHLKQMRAVAARKLPHPLKEVSQRFAIMQVTARAARRIEKAGADIGNPLDEHQHRSLDLALLPAGEDGLKAQLSFTFGQRTRLGESALRMAAHKCLICFVPLLGCISKLLSPSYWVNTFSIPQFQAVKNSSTAIK
jgi:hypothetical protein